MIPHQSTFTPQRSPRSGRAAFMLCLIVFVILVLPAACFFTVFGPGPLPAPKTIVIPYGSSSRDIAAQMRREGVIYTPLAFLAASKILVGGSLKAGEYEFTRRQSTADIVLMLHEGRSVVRMLTVPEGLTASAIVALLAGTSALTGEIAAMPAEGSLLPETYRYSYGDGRAGLIGRMRKSMQEKLAAEWPKRDAGLPLKTPQEAVILASIIEKETGVHEERARIAGVFYNRLRLNMRLQSDPTVIYAITRGKGDMDHDLGHDDMAYPSPFNTYTNDGLPPQPICNPGLAAIEAALHPEHNDYLYFVADGGGGHVFARDLAAHNKNVLHLRQTNEGLPPTGR